METKEQQQLKIAAQIELLGALIDQAYEAKQLAAREWRRAKVENRSNDASFYRGQGRAFWQQVRQLVLARDLMSSRAYAEGSEPQPTRLPECYRQAEVRCVTPCDGNYIGIAFDQGPVVSRVRLARLDAMALAGLISNAVEECTAEHGTRPKIAN